MMQSLSLKSLASVASECLAGWQSPTFDAEAVHAQLTSARDSVQTCLQGVTDRLESARKDTLGMKDLDKNLRLVRLRAPVGQELDRIRAVTNQALKCTPDGLRAQGNTTRQAISAIDEVEAVLLREIGAVGVKISAYEEEAAKAK